MKQFITLLFVLTMVFKVNAQHNHSDEHNNEDVLIKHTPEHGGEIIEVGKYKLEVILNPMQIEDKLVVYILKKNNKTYSYKNGTGMIVCKYKDGKTNTLNLINQKDRFITNEIDLTKMVNIVFKFTLDNKTISGVYFYKGLTEN